ncbi:LysR substrate-binding domain-containing protein [Lacibacterium aquatile]|uniref:LysR substrate-binding domain-containing protein n=1 Tax=Lacibacterium aquatile TaxID=1168082 RepID=A0ABW5DQD3_9PROT
MRRLPPLNALKAFEAAARHQSFTAAAHELNVTQTAVSQLVKSLEERLGVALFERRGNQLSLSPRGMGYLPAVSDAFDRIAAATAILDETDARQITLGCGPTFAMRWLIPRLPDFQRAHPECEVRLSTTLAVRELQSQSPLPDGVDAAVRLYDPSKPEPGLMADPLFTADLFPVCAPGLAARLKTMADLARETLLEVRHAPGEWRDWLSAAGLGSMVPSSSLSFDFHAFALQAALDGAGVALARRPFVTDDLKAGRLIAPFALSLPKGGAWCLLYRPEAAGGSAFLKLRDWLIGAAMPPTA